MAAGRQDSKTDGEKADDGAAGAGAGSSASAVAEPSQAFLPAVLRDRPKLASRGGRGAPPPVPPRSPRRPHDEGNNRGADC